MSDLGQTRDPVELVPGDPAAIRADARILRDRSGSAERAGDGLVRVDTGAWEGPAARAFRQKFDYEPNKWFEAADSLLTAADALASFAGTLEWAQGRAGAAVRLWEDAQSRTQQARQAYEGAAVEPLPPFLDVGEAGRLSAQEMLGDARQQVAEAGDIAARFLRAEAEAAPEKSSWLDEAGDFAQDIGADLVNGLASYGNALLHHPGEVATLAGGITLMAAGVGGDGVGFALDATGVGAIAGVPLNVVSTAGIVAGAGLTVAAGGSLMQQAANENAVSPASGSQPARSAPRKTDRMKEHLTERDLDAARRELDGEVVARKPTGQPWDHVDEVRNAQRGLVNRISQLKRLLGDPRTSAADQSAYQSELSEASRLLDHSEQYVPRVQP